MADENETKDIITNSITQDNALIKSSFSLLLQEHRLLLAAVSKIDPTSSAWKAGRVDVEITAGEWMSLYGDASKAVYGTIKSAASGLYSKSVKLWSDDNSGKHIRWISGWEYNQAEGRVVLTFSGDILFELSGFVDDFTKYQIANISGLKSTHSIRLYQLAAQFKGTGWNYIKLDDLRIMFKLEGAYPRWMDLKRRVIDKAVNEINKKTDLSVSYEKIKKGRDITAIKLLIKDKEQLELEF